MKLAFLIDHDLKEAIPKGVQRRLPEAEIIYVRDVGLKDSPDEEVLAYAARLHLIVISHDENTMTNAAYQRVANGMPMPGLVMVQQSQPIGPIIEALIQLWTLCQKGAVEGLVLYLPISAEHAVFHHGS